ncbi:MAG: hypothetical protein FWB83_06015 [Treponema sp.]|nr:hypothetical protein [Treponema sp.]
MSGNYLLLLIYSCFTINLLLQCALGIQGAAGSQGRIKTTELIKTALIFLTGMLLWIFFSNVVMGFMANIVMYILIFPLSSIFYDAFEYLVFKFIIKKEIDNNSFISFPGGITAVIVFICVNIAGSFLEAAVLMIGFSSGILLVNFIIREVRRRAALEAVPASLRGKPIVLVTMGLLSLVFTTVSLLLFRMIGVQ